MSVDRCVCCDLPLSSCGKALEQARRREEFARRQRALAEPGTFEARFPGVCACGERFDAGTPLRHHGDGWVNVLEHPEGLDA